MKYRRRLGEKCVQGRSERNLILVQKDNHLRTALFWVITQRIVVSSYRRFGKTHRSHPQNNPILEFRGWDRYVVPIRLLELTTTRCVITQKSANLRYLMAEP
jgi:predicted alpha/beta hydrolase